MKATRGFFSLWVLAGLALWVVFVAFEARVEFSIRTSTGDGPEGSHVVPLLTRADWFAILSTAALFASIPLAVLAVLVLLGRVRLPGPWLLGGAAIWVVILVIAFDWVQSLELFRTYDPPVDGVVWSFTIQRNPIAVVSLASLGATLVTGVLVGAILIIRRTRSP